MSAATVRTAGPTECFYSSLAAEPDLAELVEMFVSDLPDRVAEIRRYVQFADWSEVRRLAHQLKGAGGSYGFPHLFKAAGNLENAARALSAAASADQAQVDTSPVDQSPGDAGCIDDALEILAGACKCCRAGRPPV